MEILSVIMVLPALAIVGIASAVASLIGMGMVSRSNKKSQEKQNRLDREHEEYMYNMQKQDSLDAWNRTNAYNSPEEQMNRLRQAGLNPNLVYGKGADTTAQTLSTPKPTPSSKNAPMLDANALNASMGNVSNKLMEYYDVKRTQAQTDNLNEQNALMKKEALLTDAKTANTVSQTATNDFQRAQAIELKDSVLEKAKLENQSLAQQQKALDQKMQLDLNRDERERLKNASDIAATYQQILESRARVENNEIQQQLIQKQMRQLDAVTNNTILDGKLKQLDKNLKETGIQPTDPLYLRIITQFLDNVVPLNNSNSYTAPNGAGGSW